MHIKFENYIKENLGVDKNNIMYHGSSSYKLITKFNDNTFFSPSDYIAKSYAYNSGGLLYKVEISKLTPLIMKENSSRMKRLTSGALLSGTDPFFIDILSKLYGDWQLDFFTKYGLQYHTFTALVNGNFEPLIKYAKENGYDSLKFWDESFDTFIKDYCYIIFDCSKVKIISTYEVDMTGNRFITKPFSGNSTNEAFNSTLFYHGTTDKNLNGKNGIHVGTYNAAKEALEARIGIPATGEWDGTRIYGETLLAGQRRIRIKEKNGEHCNTGFNCDNDVPEDDYLPTERKRIAVYSGGEEVSFNCKPIIFPVKIVGRMTNTPVNPYEDSKANGMMKRNLKMGNAKSDYYYVNIGEDEGSISAVVPDKTFLQY